MYLFHKQYFLTVNFKIYMVFLNDINFMIYDLYTKVIVNFFSIKGRYFLIQASVTTSDLVNHYAVLILHWFYNYYFK